MAAIVNETARSDEELAAEIARRDASERAFRAARDAFEGLYRRHAPLLLAFLSSRVHASDRDDLHQDIVYQRFHHRSKSGAHHDCHRQIDYVAAHHEVLEAF